MKQTAIEWLEENLLFEPWAEEHFEYNKECWDKAIEMEKEQMIEAYNEGYSIRDYYGNRSDNTTSEQYYNQTFKSE